MLKTYQSINGFVVGEEGLKNYFVDTVGLLVTSEMKCEV